MSTSGACRYCIMGHHRRGAGSPNSISAGGGVHRCERLETRHSRTLNTMSNTSLANASSHSPSDMASVSLRPSNCGRYSQRLGLWGRGMSPWIVPRLRVIHPLPSPPPSLMPPTTLTPSPHMMQQGAAPLALDDTGQGARPEQHCLVGLDR